MLFEIQFMFHQPAGQEEVDRRNGCGEDEAEQATKRMVTLLEPVLIILMALIVGFIMIAVMLPIYQSYSAIENS